MWRIFFIKITYLWEYQGSEKMFSSGDGDSFAKSIKGKRQTIKEIKIWKIWAYSIDLLKKLQLILKCFELVLWAPLLFIIYWNFLTYLDTHKEWNEKFLASSRGDGRRAISRKISLSFFGIFQVFEGAGVILRFYKIVVSQVWKKTKCEPW